MHADPPIFRTFFVSCLYGVSYSDSSNFKSYRSQPKILKNNTTITKKKKKKIKQNPPLQNRPCVVSTRYTSKTWEKRKQIAPKKIKQCKCCFLGLSWAYNTAHVDADETLNLLFQLLYQFVLIFLFCTGDCKIGIRNGRQISKNEKKVLKASKYIATRLQSCSNATIPKS